MPFESIQMTNRVCQRSADVLCVRWIENNVVRFMTTVRNVAGVSRHDA